MKKYTEKFLNSKATKPSHYDNVYFNAQKAHTKLQIPEALWIELNWGLSSRPLIKSIPPKEKNTMFMAGFVAGWAERNKKIK